MLICVDIGNTNIVIGCFEGSILQAEFRMMSVRERTAEEYGVMLGSMIERRFSKHVSPQGCIVSSVVPPLSPILGRVIHEMWGITPIFVGPGVKTGIAIRVADPASVGADRIVNAVAAKELYGTPALVIDFGTATSFDYVSADGAYEGGSIAPGVAISLDALVRNTAKLPRIEVAWPASVLGKGTVPAMQSGTVMGYLEMVDGLIRRFTEELGPIPHVIATGGLGRLFADHSRLIGSYDTGLTLKGLQMIAKLNGL